MKITRSMLRTLVREAIKERDTEKVAKETEEVDAKDVANTLEKPIDYVKALKLEEQRLQRRLVSVKRQLKLRESSKRKS